MSIPSWAEKIELRDSDIELALAEAALSVPGIERLYLHGPRRTGVHVTMAGAEMRVRVVVGVGPGLTAPAAARTVSDVLRTAAGTHHPYAPINIEVTVASVDLTLQ